MSSGSSPPPFEPGSRLERLANGLRSSVKSREGSQHHTQSERSNAVRKLVLEVYEEASANATEDVVDWLSSYAGEEARYMVLQEILLCFGEVLWASNANDEDSIAMVLRRIQRRGGGLMLGTKTVQRKQHCVLEDLTEDPEDPEADSSDDADPELEGDPEPQTSGIEQDRPLSQVLSPKERQLDNAELADNVSPVRWTVELKGDWTLWIPLCERWNSDLVCAERHISDAEIPSGLSDGLYRAIVNVLRCIRLVPAGVFTSRHWVEVVKATQLSSAILRWSAPEALAVWSAPYAVALLRRHKINNTMLCVLRSWTPPDVPVVVLPPSLPSPRMGQKCLASKYMKIATDILRALRKHPDIVPLAASPSSAYFLLSEQNFNDAALNWLFHGLHSRDYNTTALLDSDGRLKRIIYDSLVTMIRARVEGTAPDPDNETPLHPLLSVLYRRSALFWDLKIDVKNRRERKDGLLGAERKSFQDPSTCRKCADRPADKKCVREILVTVEEPDVPSFKGSDPASIHEQAKVLKPSARGPHKKVYHPQLDLHMKVIHCDEDVVKHCGCQIFRLIEQGDESSGHVKAFARLKGLQRGQQFAGYMQGSMVAFGPRAPSGGIPGDSLRYPDYMSATEESTLECLFDHAEDALIINEITRIIAPEVYHEFSLVGGDGEKFGTGTGSLFYCENYAAPFHQDRDAAPGICANVAFRAGPGDYCFLNLAYRDENGDRFYFAPRANSLWGGGDGQGGDDDPYIYTLHEAKTEKNVKAAAKYAEARGALIGARGDCGLTTSLFEYRWVPATAVQVLVHYFCETVENGESIAIQAVIAQEQVCTGVFLQHPRSHLRSNVLARITPPRYSNTAVTTTITTTARAALAPVCAFSWLVRPCQLPWFNLVRGGIYWENGRQLQACCDSLGSTNTTLVSAVITPRASARPGEGFGFGALGAGPQTEIFSRDVVGRNIIIFPFKTSFAHHAAAAVKRDIPCPYSSTLERGRGLYRVGERAASPIFRADHVAARITPAPPVPKMTAQGNSANHSRATQATAGALNNRSPVRSPIARRPLAGTCEEREEPLLGPASHACAMPAQSPRLPIVEGTPEPLPTPDPMIQPARDIHGTVVFSASIEGDGLEVDHTASTEALPLSVALGHIRELNSVVKPEAQGVLVLLLSRKELDTVERCCQPLGLPTRNTHVPATNKFIVVLGYGGEETYEEVQLYANIQASKVFQPDSALSHCQDLVDRLRLSAGLPGTALVLSFSFIGVLACLPLVVTDCRDTARWSSEILSELAYILLGLAMVVADGICAGTEALFWFVQRRLRQGLVLLLAAVLSFLQRILEAREGCHLTGRSCDSIQIDVCCCCFLRVYPVSIRFSFEFRDREGLGLSISRSCIYIIPDVRSEICAFDLGTRSISIPPLFSGIPYEVESWAEETFPGPNIRAEWLQSTCRTIAKGLRLHADWNEYTDELENLILNAPFSDVMVKGSSGIPSSVGSKVHTVIEGPMVLELVHMTEVGVSAFKLEHVRMERDRMFYEGLLELEQQGESASTAKILQMKDNLPDYPRQCLSLYLSDGFHELQFVEYRPLPFKLGRTSMGMKLRLTNVPFIGGVGYLEPGSIEVLGGRVKSMELAHMARLRHGFRARMVEELSLCKTQDYPPYGLYYMDPHTETNNL
ncbi:hypothetical protein NMY22_g5539 [Coprinellus aureogranulatus]|nr:hypothetical protein NMY22_g5539 [Coprinellus aureogranulatus]